MWEVNVSDEVRDWYESLDEAAQAPIFDAVTRLEERGPTLGRPLVAEISGSRIHNLKELRPTGTSIRILFVFDPRRQAILLVAADKAEHGWKAWYAGAIGQAERTFDDYLADLREQHLIE